MINALYPLAISHANDFISTDVVVGASDGLLLAEILGEDVEEGELAFGRFFFGSSYLQNPNKNSR